MSDILPVYGIS